MSGENVRLQHAFDQCDPVFDEKFSFFQPAHQQLILSRRSLQVGDGKVEVAVLNLQILQLLREG